MKKTAAALLAALLVIASLPAVLAAESATLAVTENNIGTARVVLELSTDSSMVGKAAALRVYREKDAKTIENMLWADEKGIGENGKCSFTVDMSNYDTERYVFVATVSGMSGEFCTEPLQIYGSEEKTNLLSRMKTAKANETISEVKWIAENRWEYLSLDKTGYDAIPTTAISETTEETYLDVFCKNVLKTQFESLDDFAEKFNQTVCIAKLYTATDAKATTDEILKSFGLDKSRVYAEYANVKKPELGTAVAAELAEQCLALTADNFKDSFTASVVLALLSEQLETWSGYQAILVKYATEIGIDMTDYDALNNQAAVINAMIGKHETYASLKDIVSDFNSLVNTQKAEEKKASSKEEQKRPSPGGGGGGFSGGVNNPTPIPTEPEKKDEDRQNGFSDMASCPWAEEAVNYLCEKGILSGRDDGSFDPNGGITRAEAVKILVLAFGLADEGEELIFTDVDSGKWYYRYLRIAYAAGIISGISETEFAPDAKVSRQDMAVLLDRILKRENAENTLDFSDGETIAEYAKQAVANLVHLGVISGTDEGNFEPNRDTTRAQAAKMLYEIIKTEVR